MGRGLRARLAAPLILLVLSPAALGQGDASVRTFFGLDPRITIWIVAELHLMFGAFVLGVPIFALIAEVIGIRARDPRYDRLAHEFTRLLVAAFSTTAALGGLFAFLLMGLYPAFTSHWASVFHPTFYLYGLLFFAEAFSLYLYYYAWDAWQHRKGLHLTAGILLNVFGLLLMMIANAWSTYMMSPPGLDAQLQPAVDAAGNATHWVADSFGRLRYSGPQATVSDAFFNVLWMPLNIHRFLANIAFGGAVVSGYAAVRFLVTRDPAERAHYDWMGYVGQFVAIAALITLPFAGYYLGREIYSFNPTMGQDMMGGTFSWTFIVQAALVGMLFLAANYYLWSGLQRIPGGERYERWVPWMLALLFVGFAIWLVPHNLPLGGIEKRFGLMPAKNAVVQLILLTTYTGFLMYRRANKEAAVPIDRRRMGPAIALGLAAVASCALLWLYAASSDLSDANPDIAKFVTNHLPVGPFVVPLPEGTTWAATLRGTIDVAMGTIVLACLLAWFGRSTLGQGILIGTTGFLASVWLFQHGFTLMEKANPLVRQVAFTQFLMLAAAILTCTVIDILAFRGAKSLGAIRWGRMHARSQYALILLGTLFVTNMGLMGFIRSGLRKEWHVVAILKDTSEWAATPTDATMGAVVGAIVLLFFGLIGFVFWLSALGQRGPKPATTQGRESGG